MTGRFRSLWRNLSQSLGFVPGVMVVGFGVVGIVLVEVDRHLDLGGVSVVFQGDASAARTVLSVIAGSLITVAGLTFSTTMVVLQLASSQFSPRILRTFFGDRITQVTIGTYVGTFVYSILVLRAVGSFGDSGFVPRLSITLASVLGIAAVLLLVVFLQHVSRLVQVSHVTAAIAHQTLARADALYPERYGQPAAEDGAEVLSAWRDEAEPARLLGRRPGYVQRVDVGQVAKAVGARGGRVAVLVCPGDFVSVEMPIAELWPAEALEAARGALLGAVTIADERDIEQDVDFGIRQLTDTVLRALSPGVNDPMTAVTGIRYVRSILLRLAGRAAPDDVRRFPDHDVTVVLRRRTFAEHLEALVQVGRVLDGDAWVAGEVLEAVGACVEAARDAGAHERLPPLAAAAAAVAEQAVHEARTSQDRRRITVQARRVATAARDA